MAWKQRIRKLWLRAKSQAKAYWDSWTRDFSYSSDFFFGLDSMMVLAGVHLKSRRTGTRVWWNIYRVLISVPMLAACWNVPRQQSLALGMACLISAIGSAITTLRMMIVVRNYNPLMVARRFINRRMFGRDLELSEGIRGDAFRRNRRYVFVAMAAVVVTWILTIIVDVPTRMFDLPFQDRIEDTTLQSVCEYVVKTLIIGVAVMIMFATLVVVTVLHGMCTELKVGEQFCEGFIERANISTNERLYYGPGSSSDLSIKGQEYFWKFVQEELAECVKLQQQFLDALDTVRPLLNGTFLVTYYATVLSVSCGACYVIYMRSITLYAWIIVYYSTWLMIECLIFTRFVTQLTDLNESIGEAMYNSNWPTALEFDEKFAVEYRSAKLTMLTVMAVSQQPLRLNCFGFFEFTQEKFTEMVDLTYSLGKFFWNFVKAK